MTFLEKDNIKSFYTVEYRLILLTWLNNIFKQSF
jgi:hypothetical protein